MRSRFWWASFSNRTKSCISTGPRGPAVMLFWLSETGMPPSVVSVGRLATDCSCIARLRYPGNATARGSATHAFATSWTELRLRKAGANGNVCVRLAMTLVLLLRLHRFCANLQKPEVIRLPAQCFSAGERGAVALELHERAVPARWPPSVAALYRVCQQLEQSSVDY